MQECCLKKQLGVSVHVHTATLACRDTLVSVVCLEVCVGVGVCECVPVSLSLCLKLAVLLYTTIVRCIGVGLAFVNITLHDDYDDTTMMALVM